MRNNLITKRAKAENGSFRRIAGRQALSNSASVEQFNTRFSELNSLRLSNSESLLRFRESSQDRIDKINKDFFEATQRVLNDKTLDFLIQHSNINAPTLTSIFAGFELARASRADRLDLQRQAEIESIEAGNQRQADLNVVRDSVIESEQKILGSNLDQRIANNAVIAQGENLDLREAQDDEDARIQQRNLNARNNADNAARLEQEQIRATNRNQSQQQRSSFFSNPSNFNVTPLPSSNPLTPAPQAANTGLTQSNTVQLTSAPLNPLTQQQVNNIENRINDELSVDPVQDDQPNQELNPVLDDQTNVDVDGEPELDQFAQRRNLLDQFVENQDDSLLAPINELNTVLGTDQLDGQNDGIISALAALPSSDSDDVVNARTTLLSNLTNNINNESQTRVNQIESSLSTQRELLARTNDPAQRASLQAAIAQQEDILLRLQS